MAGRVGFAVISLATIMCSIPAEAAYFLNCRLMDSDTPPGWRKGCKWETIISECQPNELCKVKRQNIVSVSAIAALTANLKLRTSVLVNSPMAESASLAAAMDSRTTTATVSTAGSGALGGGAGTLSSTVSGATGTVNRTVSGLGL